MPATTPNPFQKVLSEIASRGILLESDPALPSVVSAIIGKPVRASWWGHPRGHEIHELLGRLAQHSDIAIVKLISGKTTYVHRDLWPPLLAIATAREPWQLNKLSNPARRLLQLVDDQAEVRCDHFPPALARLIPKPGDAARELERRLLVYSEQFHTEDGYHTRRLLTWSHWARRANCSRENLPSPHDARSAFEQLLHALHDKRKSKARLPWT
ncbi:MAG: hypothetical protein L0219_15570 [Phycisphaerales bacterium]|nr:hypothetical protein [Phycisphaerales bacterium]